MVAIIAILAAMLLPALAAAREKARRSACMNNLGQLARATESYLGDYSGYYPVSPAVDAYLGYYDGSNTRSSKAHHPGTYQDVRDIVNGRPRTIFTGGVSTNYSHTSLWSAIGAGSSANAACNPVNMYPSEDLSLVPEYGLKIAPNGMGYLLVGGYIGEPGVYYCPSSEGMPHPRSRSYEPGEKCARNIKSWKTSGGMDPKILTHGNWKLGY